MIAATKANPKTGVSPAQFSPAAKGLIQRKCACGGSAGLSGECTECQGKRLQRKPTIGSSSDPMEQEADRVAESIADSGRPAQSPAVPGANPVPRPEAIAAGKPRDQPTTFPVEEQPKHGKEKEDEDKEKLKTGALKAAGEFAKFLWDEFSTSQMGAHILAQNEHDLKKIIEFFKAFSDTAFGKIALGAAGGGAATGTFLGALSARDKNVPPDASSGGAFQLRAPKDEKFFALELKWDFITPPTGVTIQTPWIDSPEIGGSSKKDEPKKLQPAPKLIKPTPSIPKICTPADPADDHGEAAARSAQIYSWLLMKQQQDGEKMNELLRRYTQTIQGGEIWRPGQPYKFKQSHVSQTQPLFKRCEGAFEVADPQVIDAGLNSSAQSLDAATRADMEMHFGHDFSQVRVHADSNAAQSARAVNAQAYTVGRDVVFETDRYAPGTREGRRLIAHELTHVVQQRGNAGLLQRQPSAGSKPASRPDPAPGLGPARAKDVEDLISANDFQGAIHPFGEKLDKFIARRDALRRELYVKWDTPFSVMTTVVGIYSNDAFKQWEVWRKEFVRLSELSSALKNEIMNSIVDQKLDTNRSDERTLEEQAIRVADSAGNIGISAFETSVPRYTNVEVIERVDSVTFKTDGVVKGRSLDLQDWLDKIKADYEAASKKAKEGKMTDKSGALSPESSHVTKRNILPTSAMQEEAGAQAPDSSQAGMLQRAAMHPSESDPHSSEAPPIVNEVLRSPGQPLDSVTRDFMEPRFGHNFSGVRVHTDAKAGESARAVNALAYTVGRDIVFDTSWYAPETKGGQWLLAHELSHVVQQSGASAVQGREVIQQRRQEKPENQANRAAASVIAEGEHLPLPSVETGPLALQPFTPYEFLSNIPIIGLLFRGILEGDFSEQDLAGYLQNLERRNAIEGRIESDNKARAVVRMWKGGSKAIELNPKRKRLLVKEMKDGDLSKDDALGILDILEVSEDQDLREILGPQGVTVSSLLDGFGKNERLRLEQFLNRRFKGGVEATRKGVIEPMSAPTALGQLNDETFRKRWEQGLEESIKTLNAKVDAGGCRFPRPKETEIDNVNWRPFQSNFEMIVTQAAFTPVKAAPFEAVDLLFDNLDKWTCDCRLFPEIALLGAWHEALKDRPEVFNNKFTPLVLRAEGTSGLEREVIETEADAPWRDAPVGTKVVWTNESPAARVPWTAEHAIKRKKGKPGEPDKYAAQGVGFDKTEEEVKRTLAEHSSDFPWIYRITASILKDLQANGVSQPIIQSLRTIENLDVKSGRAFLGTQPLLNLRKQAPQDPPRFEALINNILGRARLAPVPAEAEQYIRHNIKRFKIEIPK